MQVLWWLAPPLVATTVAMLWAGWAGRTQHDSGSEDSAEALDRMRLALARPTPARGTPMTSVAVEPTHGVAVRGTRRQRSVVDSPR